MKSKIGEQVKRIYRFMTSIYAANWQTRWAKTPYMPDFVQPDKLTRFVQQTGKFESIPGHVWATQVLWMELRSVCPFLNGLINSEELYERLLIHDLGETNVGDTPLVARVSGQMNKGRQEEREDFIRLINILPKEEQIRLLGWFDEYENENITDVVLETLVARWLDNLQGDHFALTFGSNLPENSVTIEKIIKRRSIARARALIHYLQKVSNSDVEIYRQAATEVEEVTKTHIEHIRKAGITLDLTELGF